MACHLHDCDTCSNELPTQEAHVCHACSRPSYLCDGCAYDCVECGWTFCLRHICIERLAEHRAVYRCEACEAKRVSEQQEAA